VDKVKEWHKEESDWRKTREKIEAHLYDVFEMNLNRREEVLSFVQRIANIVSHILHERMTILN